MCAVPHTSQPPSQVAYEVTKWPDRYSSYTFPVQGTRAESPISSTSKLAAPCTRYSLKSRIPIHTMRPSIRQKGRYRPGTNLRCGQRSIISKRTTRSLSAPPTGGARSPPRLPPFCRQTICRARPSCPFVRTAEGDWGESAGILPGYVRSQRS